MPRPKKDIVGGSCEKSGLIQGNDTFNTQHRVAADDDGFYHIKFSLHSSAKKNHIKKIISPTKKTA